MRANQLRHFVNIQAKSYGTPGAHGEASSCWQNLYENVPASVMGLAGRELELTHEIVPTATHTVRTRFLPDLSESHRIVWGCRVLNIGNIQTGDRVNDGRELGLTFVCTEDKSGVET